MITERPTRGEQDAYYGRYDNDSLYVYLRQALFGLSVVFTLCFLLWPLGLHQSADWPSVPLETSQPAKAGASPDFFYRVEGETFTVNRWYFGGNPPPVFGSSHTLTNGQRVFFDPTDSSNHVVHKTPSWLTVAWPFLTLASLLAARRVKRSISADGLSKAHPFRN